MMEGADMLLRGSHSNQVHTRREAHYMNSDHKKRYQVLSKEIVQHGEKIVFLSLENDGVFSSLLYTKGRHLEL
jgi:hypothetical protein